MNEQSQILVRWFQRKLKEFSKYHSPGELILLFTAMGVGLGAGIGAVIFRWLINAVRQISYQWIPDQVQGLGMFYLILVPTLGGIIVGPLIYFFAREAKGHGVPEVMEAVALRGGRIRPAVAVVKSLASSLCIGTGGSVGREGPIVQIGSALGSTVGQVLKWSDDRVRNLVACGAAAGIAATFNAPIAGVIFALEVILGDFGVRTFGTVVISSVTASVVGRAAFGDVPAFVVPEYAIKSLWEFPMYLVLGGLAALVAVAYTRLIYKAEDIFDGWQSVPEWVKPAIGGAILGVIALLYGQVPILSFEHIPQIYGVGYETIESGMLGNEILPAMLALMVLKILSTALTLGSGGSGGVFAPGLFIGSMLGGSFGRLMQIISPALTAPPGAYALVGMGALFAGATHASMTAVVIMFEMTGDYSIILPLMVTVVTSSLLSRYLLGGESIYTLKLTRRGVRLRHGRNVDILQRVRVDEVMTSDVVTVLPDTPGSELTQLFLQTNRHAFPVVDERGRLSGIVSLADLRDAKGDVAKKRVSDLMTRSLITVFPDETLDVVLKKMGPRDLSRLPVVSREDPNLLVGDIRRNDVVSAYNLALTHRAGDVEGMPAHLRPAANEEFLEIELTRDAPCIGITVAEMSHVLPSESLLISIRRSDGTVIFPHGETQFEMGDRITAYVRSGRRTELRRCFGNI
jgi:CIC family chloride channel protein